MSLLIRPPADGPIGPRSHKQSPQNLRKFFRQQNRKNDVMGKSTPTLTLTQSGLLTVLLQRQRYVRFQLAERRAHGKHLRAAAWRTLTWPWRALTAPKPLDDSAVPVGELTGTTLCCESRLPELKDTSMVSLGIACLGCWFMLLARGK